MAYDTFIPTIWNEALNRELRPKYKLAQHTNREYEGDVKQAGDSVRILNVGRPTIYSTTTDSKETFHTNINGPEMIDNSSITLQVKQIRYFNYYVGDIDKWQMLNDGKVMAAYRAETTDALANEVDVYLGQTIFVGADVPVITNAFSNSTYGYIKVTAGDSDSTPAPGDAQNVLELLDEVVLKARQNNIPDSTPLYVDCTPKFFGLVRRALAKFLTDNVKIVEGREYVEYNNLRISWSNNVKTVAAVDGVNAYYEYVTVRTDRAVAYVHPLTHSEPYRPEGGFSDAIKGYIVFDAMVTRPKEIFNIKVTY